MKLLMLLVFVFGNLISLWIEDIDSQPLSTMPVSFATVDFRDVVRGYPRHIFKNESGKIYLLRMNSSYSKPSFKEKDETPILVEEEKVLLVKALADLEMFYLYHSKKDGNIHHISLNNYPWSFINRFIHQFDKKQKYVMHSRLSQIKIVFESRIIEELLEFFAYDFRKYEIFNAVKYLLHQDNVALEFARQGGFQLLSPFLYSKEVIVAINVASIFGAAVQNKPTVQKIALDKQVGVNLAHSLTKTQPGAVSAIIFALSSLLRNHFDARREFIYNNGIYKLSTILSGNYETSIKMIVVSFLSDLCYEMDKEDYYKDPSIKEEAVKVDKFFVFDMLKYDVCKFVTSLLYEEDFFQMPERVIRSMLVLDKICHQDFKKTTVMKRLKDLLEMYRPGVRPNPYFNDSDNALMFARFQAVKQLLLKIDPVYDPENMDSKEKIRDEL